MIIGILGPEGSNKTASMTWLTGIHHGHGGKCFAFPGYDAFTPPDKKGEQYYMTETMQIGDWIQMLASREQVAEYDGALIDIDEIQQFFDAQQWASLASRLFGYVATQRRKRGLTIIYTVMQTNWVNNRLRDLTHLFINCWDVYWSAWGKETGLHRGEMGMLTYFDNKGFFTGQPKAMMGQIRLNTKLMWPCFESYSVVDVWEAMTKVVLKGRPEIEIDIGYEKGGKSPHAEVPIAPPANSLPIIDMLQGGFDSDMAQVVT